MAEFIVTLAHFVMDEFNASSASRLRRLRGGKVWGSSREGWGVVEPRGKAAPHSTLTDPRQSREHLGKQLDEDDRTTYGGPAFAYRVIHVSGCVKKATDTQINELFQSPRETRGHEWRSDMLAGQGSGMRGTTRKGAVLRDSRL